MIDDYRKHAVVWDWDGFDNSLEYEYWCKYARQYGKKVLIPMCALGQVGAYMAQKGFSVTAFDITKEMIDEGEKRFRSVENLSLKIADICILANRILIFALSQHKICTYYRISRW